MTKLERETKRNPSGGKMSFPFMILGETKIHPFEVRGGPTSEFPFFYQDFH